MARAGDLPVMAELSAVAVIGFCANLVRYAGLKQSLVRIHAERLLFNTANAYSRPKSVNDQDANLEQIRRGCGWHYKKYQNEQILDDQLSYGKASESARASKVGLWVDAVPMPPWDWRKVGRK